MSAHELEPWATAERRCPACGGAVATGAIYCPTCGRVVSAPGPEMDIGGWINRSWNLFAQNPAAVIGIPLVTLAPFVVVGVLAGLTVPVMAAAVWGDLGELPPVWLCAVVGLSVLVLGLVVPALTAGVYGCFLSGVRTGRLSAERLGIGFRNWWACTWVCWVLGFAMLFCLPFCAVLVGFPGVIAVQTLLWLAVFRIADHGAGGVEALRFAADAMRGRFWMLLLFTFLAALVSNVGAMALGVGLLVSVPVSFGALAAAYDDLSKRESPQPRR